MKNCKLIPPDQGQPQSKFANGKPFHWCAKCKYWMTLHGTTAHTGGLRDSNPQANIFLVPDPSAWNIEFPACMTLFALLVVSLPPLLLAMFLGGFLVLIHNFTALEGVPSLQTTWGTKVGTYVEASRGSIHGLLDRTDEADNQTALTTSSCLEVATASTSPKPNYNWKQCQYNQV